MQAFELEVFEEFKLIGIRLMIYQNNCRCKNLEVRYVVSQVHLYFIYLVANRNHRTTINVKKLFYVLSMYVTIELNS